VSNKDNFHLIKLNYLTTHEVHVLNAILTARECFINTDNNASEQQAVISRSDGMFQYYAPVPSESIASAIEFEDFETGCFSCCSMINRPLYFAAHVQEQTVYCCKNCFKYIINKQGKAHFKYVLNTNPNPLTGEYETQEAIDPLIS